MDLKTIATNFNNQKLSGIKSIKKHPSVDAEIFSSYGKLFLQKYFLNDGRKPNKMVAFGAKESSFSNPIVFIIYDILLQPALFFEFKDDFDLNGFIKFVGDFITKSKFKVPSKRVKENLNNIIQEINFEKWGEKFMLTVIPVLSGILTVASVVMLAMYYFKSMKYAAEEYYVNSKIENDLNKQLFAGQAKDESAFKMFSRIENYINLVIAKQINSLILCGPPGMSKTYMVRRTLHFSGKSPGKDYTIEKGSALGINAIFQLLYDYRNKLIVLDDFDTPLQNEDVINLMKAVTDSYGKRIVSLSPEKFLSTGDQSRSDAPSKFEFTGQIIMITNKKKDELDLALRSRSPVVEVNFDSKEVLEGFDKLLKFLAPQVPFDIKMEVFNYVKLLYKNDPSIKVSFRSIKSIIDARVGNPEDWKEMARLIVDYKGKPIKEMLISNSLAYLY